MIEVLLIFVLIGFSILTGMKLEENLGENKIVIEYKYDAYSDEEFEERVEKAIEKITKKL